MVTQEEISQESRRKKNILASVWNRHLELIAGSYLRVRTLVGILLIAFYFLYSYFIHFIPIHPMTALFCGICLLAVNYGFYRYHRWILKQFWTEPEFFYKKFKQFLYAQISVDWIALVLLCISQNKIYSGLFVFFLIHCLLSVSVLDRQSIVFYTIILNITILGLLSCSYFYFNSIPQSLIQDTVVFILVSNSLIFVNYKLTVLRYEAYEMYEGTKEKLESLDKEKSEYILLVTHELKAPLGVVQNYAKLILGGYAGAIEAKTKDLLQKVLVRTSTMMESLKDMLQYTNLQTFVQIEEKLVQFSPEKELNKIVESLSLKERIKLEFPESVPFLIGNPEQFQILFTNLLNNAIKYSKENTPIRISMFQEQKKSLMISVQDQGIGISPDHLHKLFQPFFRTKEGVAFNPHGTGLGLSICKKIVDMNRAIIQVKSIPGEGSTFSVEWPVFFG